jgi:hypothetical protein
VGRVSIGPSTCDGAPSVTGAPTVEPDGNGGGEPGSRRILTHLGHLTRRFAGMLSRRPVGPDDLAWVEASLGAAELALWRELSVADQRHSLMVARRFASGSDDAEGLVAALLHDIGKLSSGLGTFSRVAATVVGPRTRRFRLYHDHEPIGAAMLRRAGSSDRVVGLVDGTSPDRETVAALRRADDI